MLEGDAACSDCPSFGPNKPRQGRVLGSSEFEPIIPTLKHIRIGMCFPMMRDLARISSAEQDSPWNKNFGKKSKSSSTPR
jgi:hypothetical protein